MLVDVERVLVLYCPACAVVQSHHISLFSVKRNAPKPIPCTCGFNQGHIERRDDAYRLGIFLPSGERVRLRFGLQEFQQTAVLTLRHPETQEELGFFGIPSSVNSLAASWRGMVSLDAEEYVRPEIMESILDFLGGLAAEERITCGCRRPSVGIDVYTDKVELICAHCGSAVLIGAATQKDVERVRRIDRVTMEPASFTFLDEWLKPFE